MTTTPPYAPPGYLAIREPVSDTTQVTHLTPAGLGHVSSDGPTLCGLRRFDIIVDGRVTEPADITWTSTAGHTGPGVAQGKCSACWELLEGPAADLAQLDDWVTPPRDPDRETFVPTDAGHIERLLQTAGLGVTTPLDEIQDQVAAWTQRFRPPGEGANPLADALIIAEEAGEVCRAVLKRAHGLRPDTDWEAQLFDELGDLAIAMLSLAANEGWSLAEIITERWAEVSQR